MVKYPNVLDESTPASLNTELGFPRISPCALPKRAYWPLWLQRSFRRCVINNNDNDNDRYRLSDYSCNIALARMHLRPSMPMCDDVLRFTSECDTWRPFCGKFILPFPMSLSQTMWTRHNQYMAPAIGLILSCFRHFFVSFVNFYGDIKCNDFHGTLKFLRLKSRVLPHKILNRLTLSCRFM